MILQEFDLKDICDQVIDSAFTCGVRIVDHIDPVEYGVPPKWININDDEIRGMIRALRWVLDDSDENLL